jgi:sec-independent protein translocase protein TatB
VFSVSPAEIVTIAIVALVVFGPQRLPEIARRAGRVLRDLRNAASEFRSSIESEYGETLEPLDRARRELTTGLDAIDGAEHPAPIPEEDDADGA